MIIYIRHAHDSYPNATHRHDHHITDKGVKDAKKLARKLIKKYGYPKLIICSPFQRTRETLNSMLTEFGYTPDIVYDASLSRYFSKKDQKDPSMFSETTDAGIPVYETFDDFKIRVHKHLKNMLKNNYFSGTEPVWCITHALFFLEVARKFHIAMPKHVPFLDYIRITKEKKNKNKKYKKK